MRVGRAREVMVREGSAFGDTGRSQGGHREIVSYKPHLCHQLGVTSPLALDGVDQREVPRLQDDMVWGVYHYHMM